MQAARSSQMTKRHDHIERIAMGASLLCLIHCLALPLVIALLPILGKALPLGPDAHVWLLLFVAPTSGCALALGFRRHRRLYALLLGLSGLALVAAGVLLFLDGPWETPTTVFGSLLLSLAHILNWRLRHADCARATAPLIAAPACAGLIG